MGTPLSNGEENERTRHGEAKGRENFRFGQEYQSGAKARREGKPQPLACQPLRKKDKGEDRKEDAMNRFMAIGRDKIIIADVSVLVEGKYQRNRETDHRGGQRVRCPS